MRASYLFTILIIASVISCSKKDDGNVLNAKTDTIASPDTTLIPSIGYTVCDDTAGTNWTNYNVMIEGIQYWIPVYHNFDTDNDQVPEFRLISEMYGSPGGGGYFGYAMIESLDSNTLFSGTTESDTTFYHMTSTYFPQIPPQVIFSVREYYSCYDLTGADSLMIGNSFRVVPLLAGDTVGSNYAYHTGYKYLINRNRTFSGATTPQGPDTVPTHLIYYNANECNNFPMDTIQFIGFKTKVNNVDKHGWLKLKITEPDKIFIYSMAIQK